MRKDSRFEESEATKKKWFSRRHETSEAHKKASAVYQAERGKKARQLKAQTRQEVRSQRTPQEQLAELDQRLGNGQGASRERSRLQVDGPKS